MSEKKPKNWQLESHEVSYLTIACEASVANASRTPPARQELLCTASVNSRRKSLECLFICFQGVHMGVGFFFFFWKTIFKANLKSVCAHSHFIKICVSTLVCVCLHKCILWFHFESIPKSNNDLSYLFLH